MLCRCSSYLHPNFEWRGGGGVWIVLLSAVTLFEYNVSTIFIAYCFINCSSLRPIYWYIKIPTLLTAFKKKGKTIRCPNFRGCHQLSHTYCLPAGSLRMRLAMLQYMMSPYEAGWAACVFEDVACVADAWKQEVVDANASLLSCAHYFQAPAAQASEEESFIVNKTDWSFLKTKM